MNIGSVYFNNLRNFLEKSFINFSNTEKNEALLSPNEQIKEPDAQIKNLYENSEGWLFLKNEALSSIDAGIKKLNKKIKKIHSLYERRKQIEAKLKNLGEDIENSLFFGNELLPSLYDGLKKIDEQIEELKSLDRHLEYLDSQIESLDYQVKKLDKNIEEIDVQIKEMYVQVEILYEKVEMLKCREKKNPYVAACMLDSMKFGSWLHNLNIATIFIAILINFCMTLPGEVYAAITIVCFTPLTLIILMLIAISLDFKLTSYINNAYDNEYKKAQDDYIYLLIKLDIYEKYRAQKKWEKIKNEMCLTV